ncbi:MAG TPA: S-layer protein [Methanofastidiosum sp.]|nr:S-layer protein [Methanofastidiosum sp.]
MKLRTIGAVLAGAAMIGATVAGAAAAAQAPAKSWFIDPATGQPNVTVVVGAQANASDVVSASLIAAAIGNMATVEEEASTTKTASVKWEKVGEYNYSRAVNILDYNTTPCLSKRPARWYTDYALYSSQLWETSENNWPNAGYDTYVQLAMPSDVRNPTGNVVAKGLSTLWFSNSPKEWDSKDRVYKFAVGSAAGTTRNYILVNTVAPDALTAPIARTLPAYAGGSYDDGDGAWDFNTYGFFTTKAWVDVDNSGTYSTSVGCDYLFGGTGTAMEAHEEIQLIVGDKYESDPGPNGIADFIGDRGSASGIVYRTAEIRYPLLENGQNICGIKKCWGMIDFETARAGYLNEIKFLGKMYKPMFAGATWTNTVDGLDYYLGGYFMYGKPFAEKEKIMKVGDVYNFHGWTVTLNDVNIYENKAYITVAGPALTAPFTFIMVMDAIGVEACGPCCPECATYGGGGAFTSNPTRRTEYDPYVKYTTVTKEKSGYSYDFFRYVNFMLDGIKTFVGADGTYLAEFNLYAIEDYGYLEDKGCCDPFVTTPNDYGLAITGGWRRVIQQTIDEGDWVAWEENAVTLTSTTHPIEEYVLWRPAAQCGGYCPDANFDTLELQLCDTINIPNCETTYTVNGPENYFTVEVVDVDFGKYNAGLPFATTSTATTYIPATKSIDTPTSLVDAVFTDYDGSSPVYVGQTTKDGADLDGVYLRINMSTKGDTIKYTANVKIDPVELIKLDIEVNTATNTRNLILVGGPVYNSIVKDLVDMGASTVDWATSAGEWEWIADPMAKGYDVLIVAGANREETRMAAEDLVAMLN